MPDRLQLTARMVDDGWVLPWGLARQADPASPGFVARQRGEGVGNRTGRRWTPVGPAGGPAASVDPAGLVTPRLDAWSVDWWVGADDRWRLPSREPAVRQGLVGSTPVVETAMRVPGGDAVHRCYGVPGSIVVEVENRSPSPFALALVVRPCDPLGAVPVTKVAIDGERVLVDGDVALVLAARPGRLAVSTGAEGDVAGAVLGGRAVVPPTGGGERVSASCAEGLASAAVIVPVAHRATVRAVIPLGTGRAVAPDGMPSVDAVARGWRAQGRSGMRAELPDPLLQRAFDAARCALLLADPDDPGPAREAAIVVTALSRLGRHAEAGELVRALWSRQRTDGSFDEDAPVDRAPVDRAPVGRATAGGAPGGGAPGGPHLWALGEHLRLRADAGLASALDRSLVAAEGWLREQDGRGRLSEQDRRWAAAGRRVAGEAAGRSGLAVAASALFEGAAASGGSGPGPPTSTAAAALALAVAGPGSASGRPAVSGAAGFDVVATVAAAAAELAERDPRALERLGFLLGAGNPTWAWPDHIHPGTGAGSQGSGDSPTARAGFLLLVRDLLAVEPAEGHVVLLPVLPEAWRGQPVEVHDVALAGGVRLSFVVRWHGARPALLWEASQPLRLTAPGLDPTFTAHGARGEALLAAVTSTLPGEGGTVELS